MGVQSVSPMGSRENLRSPQSPIEGQTPGGMDWGPPGSSRKNSLVAESVTSRRASMQDAPEHQQQSTSEMFKDMLSQKRNLLLSKLTSFDSDVSFLDTFNLFIYKNYAFLNYLLKYHT